MASVPVEISGVLYDKINRTQQSVVLVGTASIHGLGIGGGPIMPPPDGGQPPGIWPDPGHPAHPIAGPPEWGHHPAHPIAPGGPPPSIWPEPGYPAHPIAPGGQGPSVPTGPIIPVPPNTPNVPPPGSPAQVLPGAHPVQPMPPPPAVVIEYPGVGRVIVPCPAVPEAPVDPNAPVVTPH